MNNIGATKIQNAGTDYEKTEACDGKKELKMVTKKPVVQE